MKRFTSSAMPIAIGALIMTGFTASITALADDANASVSGQADIVATVIAADVDTSNGVIHVVDTVILPD